MTMSKDHVRFTLPFRYFQSGLQSSNGFSRATLQKILHKVFSMLHSESAGLMDACKLVPKCVDGFEIECRPDQFARFIVMRCDAGEDINSIRDLKPRIVQPSSRTLYEQVGDSIGVDSHVVKTVALALAAWNLRPPKPAFIDVSQRSAQ